MYSVCNCGAAHYVYTEITLKWVHKGLLVGPFGNLLEYDFKFNGDLRNCCNGLVSFQECELERVVVDPDLWLVKVSRGARLVKSKGIYSITTRRVSYVGVVGSRILDRMTTSDPVHRGLGRDPKILRGLEGLHRDKACLYQS